MTQNTLSSHAAPLPTHGTQNGVLCFVKTPDMTQPADTHTPPSPDATAAETLSWYLLRASYGMERKAKEALDGKHIETFLPTEKVKSEEGGKVTWREQSLIPNLLFVRSTEQQLRKAINDCKLKHLHFYLVPQKQQLGDLRMVDRYVPLVIPDEQMLEFRRWNGVDDTHKLFVPEAELTLELGEWVRVTDGKFAGLQGRVCRLKGQTRVGISIDGLGTLFTAYIPKAFLEHIDPPLG